MPKHTHGLPDITSLLEGGFNEETVNALRTRLATKTLPTLAVSLENLAEWLQ